MTWDVKYIPDENIVQIETTGTFTLADSVAQIKEAVQLLKENEALLVLCDFSYAVSEISIADLYSLPKLYLEHGAPRTIKVGMVLPGTGHRHKDYNFWETRCRNEGFNVKIFDDTQTAKEWLSY